MDDRRAHERGESTVGSAILFVTVLFAMFLLIQLLLGFYARSVANFAATDAAALMAQEGATAEQGETYARSFILDQAGGLVLANALEVRATKGAEFTTVSVTGQTRLVWSIALNTEASAPVERFEPQG